MSIIRVRSVLSAVLVGLVATFGSVGSAQAALYTGRYDPAFGAPFLDLGWDALVVFDVPDACLALGNGNSISTSSGPCASFSVVSGKVDFYNLAVPGTILETFNLSPNVGIGSVDITGGKLSGVDSNLFDYFVPGAPSESIAGGGDYGFRLGLFDDQAELAYLKPPTTGVTCLGDTRPDAICGYSDNVQGVFAPIPEPETYALMLVGLGALGFAARRRRS